MADLLQKIFVKDPNLRIDMEGLRSHPWVTPPGALPPVKVPPAMPGRANFAQISNIITSIGSTPSSTVISMSRTSEEPGIKKSSAVSSIIGVVSKTKRHSLNQPFIRESLETQLDQITEETANIPRQTQISSARRNSSILGRKIQIPLNPTLIDYRRRTSLSSQSSREPDFSRAISNTLYEEKIKRESSNTDSNLCSTISSTAENIQLWHEIHKPPKSIRACRLSMNRGTSSITLEPSMMFQGLHRALENEKSIHPELSFKRRPEFYLFECWLDKGEPNEVEFEMEICKVLFLKLHGLKSTKHKGSENKYKQILSDIILQLCWD